MHRCREYNEKHVMPPHRSYDEKYVMLPRSGHEENYKSHRAIVMTKIKFIRRK